MIIVSDTAPLNYLVLIDEIEILGKLAGTSSFLKPSITNSQTRTLRKQYALGLNPAPA